MITTPTPSVSRTFTGKRNSADTNRITLKPPFAIVKLNAGTRVAKAIIQAVRKGDPSILRSLKKTGAIKHGGAVEIARRILALSDTVRYVFFKPNEQVDSSFIEKVMVNGRELVFGAYYDVKHVMHGIVAALGLKCYSKKIGCRYITDVFILDLDNNIIERHRLYNNVYFSDTTELVRRIVPREVVERLARFEGGINRLGGVWLLQVNETPKLKSAVKARRAIIFGKYRLYGNPIIAKVDGTGRVKEVHARDPSLEVATSIGNRITGRGWYKVLWVRGRTGKIKRDNDEETVYIV